ncbi:MAG: minor capsid protein [Bdellovibrionales bacterium]|nr:minor capsid protein [Bdellovibrionales bacterium]
MNLNDFLNVPFEEGIRNFLTRTPVLEGVSGILAQRYSDEKVFGLARATTLFMTQYVQAAIGRSMREGRDTEETIQSIRKALKGVSRSYAQTVYRTNLNTAYNGARKDQATQYPDFIVGFEFSATGDKNTRPNHLAFDGTRAPANHPVWDLATPPLGFNCRCAIRQVTRPEAKRRKWLDAEGGLIPFHPKLGKNFSVGSLRISGAFADTPEFGRGG